jgi:hypothetical protein
MTLLHDRSLRTRPGREANQKNESDKVFHLNLRWAARWPHCI